MMRANYMCCRALKQSRPARFRDSRGLDARGSSGSEGRDDVGQ